MTDRSRRALTKHRIADAAIRYRHAVAAWERAGMDPEQGEGYYAAYSAAGAAMNEAERVLFSLIDQFEEQREAQP